MSRKSRPCQPLLKILQIGIQTVSVLFSSPVARYSALGEKQATLIDRDLLASVANCLAILGVGVLSAKLLIRLMMIGYVGEWMWKESYPSRPPAPFVLLET